MLLLLLFEPSFSVVVILLLVSVINNYGTMDVVTIVTFVGIAVGVVLVVGFIVVQDKVEFCNNGMGVSIVVQESY